MSEPTDVASARFAAIASIDVAMKLSASEQFRKGVEVGWAAAMEMASEQLAKGSWCAEDALWDYLRDSELLTAAEMQDEAQRAAEWEASSAAHAQGKASQARAAIIAELAEEDGSAEFARGTALMLLEPMRCSWEPPLPSMGEIIAKPKPEPLASLKPIAPAVEKPKAKKPYIWSEQNKIVAAGYSANLTDEQILAQLKAIGSRMVLKDVSAVASYIGVSRPA